MKIYNSIWKEKCNWKKHLRENVNLQFIYKENNLKIDNVIIKRTWNLQYTLETNWNRQYYLKLT